MFVRYIILLIIFILLNTVVKSNLRKKVVYASVEETQTSTDTSLVKQPTK